MKTYSVRPELPIFKDATLFGKWLKLCKAAISLA